MRFLSAPTTSLWSIATLLAGVVIAAKYFAVTVPGVPPLVDQHLFEAMLAAFGLLWIGCVFKGL